MSFLKNKAIIILSLVFVLNSSLNANNVFVGNYKFVPQQIDYTPIYTNHYLSIIEKQDQLINSLIKKIDNQSSNLISPNLISSNSITGAKITPKEYQPFFVKQKEMELHDKNDTDQIKVNASAQNPSILKQTVSFIGNKTLDSGKFVAKNFGAGIKDVFAKGLKRTGSLSLYLPLAGFVYWRITGRSALIPIQEFYRFSKLCLKILLKRGSLTPNQIDLPKDVLDKKWYINSNKVISFIWNNTFNKFKIFQPEIKDEATKIIEANFFKNRFNADEIIWGSTALLTYLFLFR